MHCTSGCNGNVFACSYKKGYALRYPLRQRAYLKAIYKFIYTLHIKFLSLARAWWGDSPHITPLPVTKFTKNRPGTCRGNVPDGRTWSGCYPLWLLHSASRPYTRGSVPKNTRSSSHSEESSRHSFRSSANRNAGLRRSTETVLLHPLTLIMNTFSPRCTTLSGPLYGC
jgi:hypothetical protein